MIEMRLCNPEGHTHADADGLVCGLAWWPLESGSLQTSSGGDNRSKGLFKEIVVFYLALTSTVAIKPARSKPPSCLF